MSRREGFRLWSALNSNGSCDSAVLACENTLTESAADVEVNPPANRPVETQPLFDTGTCKCTK